MHSFPPQCLDKPSLFHSSLCNKEQFSCKYLVLNPPLHGLVLRYLSFRLLFYCYNPFFTSVTHLFTRYFRSWNIQMNTMNTATKDAPRTVRGRSPFGYSFFRQQKFMGSRPAIGPTAKKAVSTSQAEEQSARLGREELHESNAVLDLTPAKKAMEVSKAGADLSVVQTSSVMPLAYKIVEKARRSKAKLVPVRLLYHMHDFDALTRSVDMDRALGISQSVFLHGFRKWEAVLVSDILTEYGMNRYVLAGNLRIACARDSSRGVAYVHIVEKNDLLELAQHLQKFWDDSSIEYDNFKTVLYTSLELLMVAGEGREPDPAQKTTLQQVAMIRTFAKNHGSICLSRARSFGGCRGLKELMFPGEPGDNKGARHFLLATGKSQRHRNKLLLGAVNLIETSFSGFKEKLGRNSVLDVLLFWEDTKRMPQFVETHLAYCASLSHENIRVILRNFAELMPSKGIAIDPVFATKTVKMYTGGGQSRGGDSRDVRKKVLKRNREGTGSGRDKARMKKKRSSDGILEKLEREVNEGADSDSSSSYSSDEDVTEQQKSSKGTAKRKTEFMKRLDGNEATENIVDEGIEVNGPEVEDEDGGDGSEIEHQHGDDGHEIENQDGNDGNNGNEQDENGNDATSMDAKDKDESAWVVREDRFRKEMKEFKRKMFSLVHAKEAEINRLQGELHSLTGKRPKRQSSNMSDLKDKLALMKREELLEYRSFINELIDNSKQ